MRRPLRESSTIFVDGEERAGVIAYGLRARGAGSNPEFPAEDWVEQTQPIEFTLHGDRWEVFMWEVPIIDWPSADRFERAVQTLLGRLTQSGCLVAWIGAEGMPFSDPPDLFNPAHMSGSVLAWMDDAGRGMWRIDPDEPMEAAPDETLLLLRHHAKGLADAS